MRWTSINESGEWWEDNFCTEKIHTLICSVSSATVVPVALKPSMFVLVAFTLVMFDIILARAANFKVDIVSSKLSSWGEQATSSIVFVFPPSEFCNILVSLLSLYGIWAGLSSCEPLRRLFFFFPPLMVVSACEKSTEWQHALALSKMMSEERL